jgi:hypothetical protein
MNLEFRRNVRLEIQLESYWDISGGQNSGTEWCHFSLGGERGRKDRSLEIQRRRKIQQKRVCLCFLRQKCSTNLFLLLEFVIRANAY